MPARSASSHRRLNDELEAKAVVGVGNKIVPAALDHVEYGTHAIDYSSAERDTTSMVVHRTRVHLPLWRPMPSSSTQLQPRLVSTTWSTPPPEEPQSADAKGNTPRRSDIGKVFRTLRSVAMRSYSHLLTPPLSSKSATRSRCLRSCAEPSPTRLSASAW